MPWIILDFAGVNVLTVDDLWRPLPVGNDLVNAINNDELRLFATQTAADSFAEGARAFGGHVVGRQIIFGTD